ncbi:hypothetical protein GA0115240_11932, partial [Streptomyces sp. DvalAA-14]
MGVASGDPAILLPRPCVRPPRPGVPYPRRSRTLSPDGAPPAAQSHPWRSAQFPAPLRPASTHPR